MKREAQGMQTSTAPQTLETLKTQLQNLSNVNVQNLPTQIEALNNIVQQLETQVGQLEQQRLQLQQAQQQQTQQADDMLPGGKGDKLSEKDVDKEELSKGIKEELEHTDSKTMAKEIALDHLAEDPEYYSMLEKMHQSSSVCRKSEAKKRTKNHLSPRDSEHNKNLPDFWRENFDYGEGPYMHLDKIKKITDKPALSKRDKKKKKASADIDEKTFQKIAEMLLTNMNAAIMRFGMGMWEGGQRGSKNMWANPKAHEGWTEIQKLKENVLDLLKPGRHEEVSPHKEDQEDIREQREVGREEAESERERLRVMQEEYGTYNE